MDDDLGLHDATLVAVQIDWPDRLARLEFHKDGRWTVRVTAIGVRGIIAPRAEPWGPSVSVLRARVEVVDGQHESRLIALMQSGDEIAVDAERFSVEMHEDR